MRPTKGYFYKVKWLDMLIIFLCAFNATRGFLVYGFHAGMGWVTATTLAIGVIMLGQQKEWIFEMFDKAVDTLKMVDNYLEKRKRLQEDADGDITKFYR